MNLPIDHAFDRRSTDNNGHLHVPNCRITKASVDKYFGAETQDASLHGFKELDQFEVYRDAAELVKGLKSFDAVPLMMEHVMSTATDPQKDYIVGAVTNPRWEAPYVVADLTVWDQAGIDLIQSGEQAELSAGYARDLDWTPGQTPEGLHYVARMLNIKCNHVALVRKGRVPGAIVADQAPEVSMFDKLKFPKIVAALLAAVGGEKKQETALALDSALDSELSLDAKKKHEKEPKKGTAAEGEIPPPAMDDEYEGMSEDEKKVAMKKKKDEKEAAEKKAKEEEEHAMDAKITAAVAAAEARIHGLYAAKSAVESVVGDVSLDSAEKVYRFALDKTGVDNKDVSADALPALWVASQKTSGTSTDSAHPVAPVDIVALFPGLGMIRKG